MSLIARSDPFAIALCEALGIKNVRACSYSSGVDMVSEVTVTFYVEREVVESLLRAKPELEA